MNVYVLACVSLWERACTSACFLCLCWCACVAFVCVRLCERVCVCAFFVIVCKCLRNCS